ncbi:hypothetical protein GDO81_003530 [Engystomops pustulosus]|uniref:Uncharacterized protein n=1 Tax=Engystomops pustulosus TaxID=76066 RepID=A0AAV7A1S7_ENGPU|nr:hypothetical protein GDO81_003530 [Engystomops pustulosus]
MDFTKADNSRSISHLSPFLNLESTKWLAHALIILCYCNIVLWGLPANSLMSLQSFLNSAAHLIHLSPCYSYLLVSPQVTHFTTILYVTSIYF